MIDPNRKQQIIAELQKRAADSSHPDSAMIKQRLQSPEFQSMMGGQQATPAQPTEARYGGVVGLANKLSPGIGNFMGDFAQSFAQNIGGAKPDNTGLDLQKLIAQEAIKSQFEDPTVRQLREAEIAALSQAPPEGFVRHGKTLHTDPNYVKPADQAKMDEDKRGQDAMVANIRAKAEQNLGSIEQAEKGARFFGVAGGVPTVLSPSSLPLVGDVGALLTGKPKEYNAWGERDERQVWENNINQLLKQQVVDLITEMKMASKTGATGFGSLSESEGALLQQASTALSRELSTKDALYYLGEMKKLNRKILDGNGSTTPLAAPIDSRNTPVGVPTLNDEDAYQEYLRATGQ